MLENLRSSKALIVFVVCISIFTDTFMYGLIIPVLPYALVSRAGVDPEDLQFWNTTFMASWAGALLIGSILFGWIVNRGLSGGAINTLGYTLTFDAVGQDQIGVAIGYVTMSLSLGVFFGPVVGGPLYDAAGYIWVFIPLIIFIGIEVILRLALIEPVPRSEEAISGERQRLLDDGCAAVSAELPGPNLRPRRTSLGDPSKIFTTKGSAGTSPVIILLTNRRFVIAMLALFIGNNFVGAIDTTIPVFAFNELKFSSTQVGLLLLAPSWPQFLGPLAGWLVDRAGPKWPTAFGFIFGGVALVLMRLTEHDSAARLIVLIILLTIIGTSITLFWGPIVAEVTFAVEDLEKKQPGVFGEHGALSLAFGLQNAAFGAGAMIGPIYASAVLVKAGWGTMTLVLGLVSLVTAIPVILYTGGELLGPRKSTPATADD